MAQRTPWRSALALFTPVALLASCSGGSDGGTEPPDDDPPEVGAAVTGAVQDRAGDPSGATLLVTFDEELLQADAETTSFYSVGTLNVTGATLVAPSIVRLSLDGAAVPGDVTLSVSAGLRDEDGTPSAASGAVTITSTDSIAPAATGLTAEAITGGDNDVVVVGFDDDMVESDVESVVRWSLESPIGASVDLMGATVEYDAPTRAATLTLAGGQNLETSDDIAVVLTSVRDVGGNTIEATSFGIDAVTGQVDGDVDAPELLVVYPGATANTLVYVFDEPVKFIETADLIGQVPVSGTRFTFAEASAPTIEIAAAASTSVLNGLGAEVTFAVQPEVSDAASLFGVTDLAGNPVQPVNDAGVIARDLTPPEIAPGGVTLTAVEGERNDVMEVVFDRPVHPQGLLDTERYGLLFGFFEDLRGTTGVWDGNDRVTFVLEGETDHTIQTGGTYILAVVRFLSMQGASVDEITTEGSIVAGGDAAAPSLVSARLHPAASTDVFVEFSEAIRSDVASVASAFEVGGQTATAVTLLSPRVVRATFPGAVGLGASLDVGVAALTDLAGNAAASTASASVQAADAAAPTLATLSADAVDGSAADQLTFTLSESVDLAQALLPGNYSATQNGQPLDLTGSTLRYSSVDRSIELTLPPTSHLVTGASVQLTANVLTDHAGNQALNDAILATVTGDSTAPTLFEGFVNFRESVTSTVVDVTFDEALDASANDTLAWSASGGQTVTDVERLAPERVRLTLSAALGASETITLTGATDLAGNAAAGPIAFDPAE